MLLLPRFNQVSWVNPDTNNASEMPQWERFSRVSRVSTAMGEGSEMVLLLISSPSIYSSPRFSSLRLRACSSPVRSVIPLLGASSRVRLSIVCVVMVLPISRRSAAAKLRSGTRITLGDCVNVLSSKRTFTPAACSCGICV